MPAQPRSHAPTILRPLTGNSDIVLAEALVAVKRMERSACSGDIYNNMPCQSTDNNQYTIISEIIWIIWCKLYFKSMLFIDTITYTTSLLHKTNVTCKQKR